MHSHTESNSYQSEQVDINNVRRLRHSKPQGYHNHCIVTHLPSSHYMNFCTIHNLHLDHLALGSCCGFHFYTSSTMRGTYDSVCSPEQDFLTIHKLKEGI